MHARLSLVAIINLMIIALFSFFTETNQHNCNFRIFMQSYGNNRNTFSVYKAVS